jgi:hypothetical protein
MGHKLADGRRGKNQFSKEDPGPNGREARAGDTRDLTAQRVGLASGSKAQKAYQAMLQADAAERSQDPEVMAQDQRVKQALKRGLSASTRNA